MAPNLSPDEARQSEKTGHMRYVLGISLGAAVVLLLILLVIWT